MIDFKKLAGENIALLIPYKPGKPVKELERELGIRKAIKLASNENPMGISPKSKEALISFMDELNRYPLGDCYYLRKKLAGKLGVAENKLLFGTGSNEIIELLIRTFVKSGENVVSFFPSFSVYGIIAQANGSFCKWVETDDDFKVNFEKILNTIDNNTKIVFLANPNNPTGTYFSHDELVNFLDNVRDDVLVVLDEAYYEFVDAHDYPQSVKLLDKYPNLFIMRTFSKAYGLAGFRIGYVIGSPEGIDMLNRVRQPFNVNMAAQIVAEAALEDHEFLRKVIKNNRDGKIYLYNEFKKLGLKYYETQANFILVDVKDGNKVFNDLLYKGVIVRFLGPKLAPYIRVSIGLPEENEIFIEKLKEVLEV
ncbi:histidinol-phosphate transaminase [Deferribacter autotrophicus]|uniref:Histidinol-phosphate aminotransferase n=1 Tax=Deferribacter autotrophicus TaxID=500465 RepID=A0A5A8F539_9BACT|nr:histidinol-phosphate transaminase [Deferribacter autotrophicus]KAA0257772.1 histidinol-phosphate transaminase [Deferribacter autotrophicus]